jgi:5-methylcytosine-specific restriction enzyme A
MAVTKGHGNPDWTRDEVLIALALYSSCDGKVPGPTDARVVEVSEVLRSLPIHKGASKNDRFRNPDGVAFKLQNLRQVATGQGLGNVSSVDRAVWADFGSKPELVRQLANAIRAEAQASNLTVDDVASIEDCEEFAEGRIFTALHKVRERNPKLRSALIRRRRALGPLSCDACGDGPKLNDDALRDAAFESHHIVPLAASMERNTGVGDMALLCATCHRLIHRAMHLRRQWVSVADLQGLMRQVTEQHA